MFKMCSKCTHFERCKISLMEKKNRKKKTQLIKILEDIAKQNEKKSRNGNAKRIDDQQVTIKDLDECAQTTA